MKFEVTIERTTVERASFEIDATDEDEAAEKAENLAAADTSLPPAQQMLFWDQVDTTFDVTDCVETEEEPDEEEE